MSDDIPVCAICEKPFTQEQWDDRHDSHEDDCPNFGHVYDDWEPVSCDCDIVCHAECCPECNP